MYRSHTDLFFKNPVFEGKLTFSHWVSFEYLEGENIPHAYRSQNFYHAFPNNYVFLKIRDNNFIIYLLEKYNDYESRLAYLQEAFFTSDLNLEFKNYRVKMGHINGNLILVLEKQPVSLLISRSN